MTEIVFLQNADHKISGFECKGHSGFARFGKDIVCASISVLTINTVNSLDELINTQMTVNSNEKTGYIKCDLESPDDQTELLLRSLLLGLNAIEETYGSRYCKVTIKERKQC